MVRTAFWVATGSFGGASEMPVSTGSTPAFSSAGSTSFSRSSLSATAANTATLPSSSPRSAKLATTSFGWSVSGSHASHGASACSMRSAVMLPPATAVAWVETGHSTASFR